MNREQYKWRVAVLSITITIICAVFKGMYPDSFTSLLAWIISWLFFFLCFFSVFYFPLATRLSRVLFGKELEQ
jgi:hypothetical protein